MRRQRGFSLVELLVAMTIGTIVVGGVAAVLVSSSGLYRSADGRAQIQESARFSLGMMQEDLRMSGYMGCFNMALFGGMESRVTNLADTAGTIEGDYMTRISGFEAGTADWAPELDDAVGGTTVTPTPGSDVLMLRGPTGASLPLSEPMDNVAEPIVLASVEGLTVGGLAVISDCNYANVFIVTNLPAGKKVLHAASRNTDEHLIKAFSSYKNATVTPIGTVLYFVAPSATGVADQKALWRQVGKDEPEEVAGGVEQMQLEYGIDTDGDQAPNSFVAADAINGMPVAAVKVSMLLKSADKKLLRKAASYLFEGRSTTKAGDKSMYTPFTTTISLRNEVK